MNKERSKKPRGKVYRFVVSCGRIIVFSYLGMIFLGCTCQSKLVYQPTRQIEAVPRDYGLDYEDVSFRTDDGVKLAAWYIPADKSKNVILCCHGNGGNISHRLDTISTFHQMGLSVLMFDYRGYGQSDGSPSEEGTYKDVAAAWEYLVETRKISADRIILFGRSLGGAVAAHQADKKPPAAIILESTFTSLADSAADIYPFFPVRWLCRYDYDTKDIISGIKCPVLIVHSRDDDIIPFSHGEELFKTAAEPKQFLEITGPHNGGFISSGKVYTDGLKAFLSKYVSIERQITNKTQITNDK